MKNPVVNLLAIFLLLGAFAVPILNGIKTWRTDGEATQTASVTTAAGATSANVTLAKDLYQANITNVSSVTSSEGTDVPAVSAYDETTKKLEIAGLDDDLTRTLTIVYYGETDQEIMRIIGPFLGILIIGGLVVLLLWDTFTGKKRRGSWG